MFLYCAILIFVTSDAPMIVFPHIPKTAGTSLKYILRNTYGTKHIDSIKIKRSPYSYKDLEFAKRIFRNPQALTGHNLVDPTSNLSPGHFTLITFLREPLVRCASHYQDLVTRNNLRLSFEDWISREENQNLSVKIISGSNDLEKAKKLLKNNYLFVGITEYFTESLKLLQVLMKGSLNLQHRKLIVATDNTIKENILLNTNSLELLKKYNSLDIELYNYAISEIFLPALDLYAKEIEHITLPENSIRAKDERKFRSSKRFNKLVYRQLIKLLSQ